MSLLPKAEPLLNGVVVTLDDGHTLRLATATQARQLGDLMRKAENWLDEQARDRGTRKDRDTALLMNEINAEAHREYGHTIAGWPPAPVQRIPITACECTRTVLCDEHRDAS